ncbi:MAG: hypothetical protein P4M01_13155 [Acidobacteriota bacterium]|nr:hypothetical protein [Acidobacteriota bacterium]
MANNKTPETPQMSTMAMVAPLAGWLVPGLGHVLQKRPVRGGLIFLSVLIMFVCGLGMQGKVYGLNAGDLLDMLGFVGDFGNGLFYFLARAFEWGGANIFRATSDYGTKFLVCGGLLNVIAAIDAHQIAIGKKQ